MATLHRAFTVSARYGGMFGGLTGRAEVQHESSAPFADMAWSYLVLIGGSSTSGHAPTLADACRRAELAVRFSYGGDAWTSDWEVVPPCYTDDEKVRFGASSERFRRAGVTKASA